MRSFQAQKLEDFLLSRRKRLDAFIRRLFSMPRIMYNSFVVVLLQSPTILLWASVF
jgi:hypothetical protein